MRGLGPASERWLEAAGITTPDELDELGAVDAYRRTIAAGAAPTLNLLYAIEAALLDVHWMDLPESRKRELRDELG
jgi:DNA transformation protein